MQIDRRRALQASASASMLLLAPRIGADSPTGAGPIVETQSGKVRGTARDGVRIFKGIPYGASTAGPRRFTAPEPVAPWPGIRETVAYGHQCPQNMHFNEVLAPQAPSSEGYSEDCLVLNVWTPDTRHWAKRPVMFWCHGGGFFQESGSWPWVDGAALARRGDVVVVTLNHRLNLFGYLHLADIGGEKYAASGSAGMLDLVLALEWVRDNIAAFGGDPGNVMIFGESGGGAKVCTLLAMPAAKGLFHRAAAQSGSSVRAMDRADADRAARSLLRLLDIPAGEVDRLQRVPVATLLAALPEAMKTMPVGPAGLRMGFSPVMDGRYVASHPFDPVATPLAATVPMLVGCNHDEMALFALGDPDAFRLDEAMLQQRLAAMLGKEDAARAIALYRQISPAASPSELFIQIGTDSFIRRGATIVAERKAAQQAAVYAYLFTWRSPAMGGRLGATHTVEIPFVFDNTDVPVAMTRGGPEVKALAAKVSDAWIAFARSGDPSHAGLPAWPRYDTGRRATMMLNVDARVEDDPDARKRLFWQSIPA